VGFSICYVRFFIGTEITGIGKQPKPERIKKDAFFVCILAFLKISQPQHHV